MLWKDVLDTSKPSFEWDKWLHTSLPEFTSRELLKRTTVSLLGVGSSSPMFLSRLKTLQPHLMYSELCILLFELKRCYVCEGIIHQSSVMILLIAQVYRRSHYWGRL